MQKFTTISLKILLASWVILLLGGCSSSGGNYDYLPGTDFSGLKSYAWMPVGDNDPNSHRSRNQMVDQRIQNAINNTLAKKGFKKTSRETADFLVNYHVTVAVQQQQSRGAVSVGTGRHSGRSSMSFGVTVPVGGTRTHKDGTLVIDIIDPNNNSALWQGNATRTVQDDWEPDRVTAVVNEVVEEILVNFPPKSKK